MCIRDSFATVHGGRLRRRAPAEASADGLPMPTLKPLDHPFNLLVTGIGGTGIVTIGALVGMAAHLDGLHVSVLDQMGMAQKGGAVTSHIRIGKDEAALHGLRIGRGAADLLLACDMVVAAGRDSLATLREGVSHVVLNTHEVPTGDFVLHPDTRLPAARLRRGIADAAATDALDATAIALGLLGDTIAANPLLLGFAWQRGLLPLSLDSLLGAIALNGNSVEANTAAFTWGRRAAIDLAAVQEAAGLSTTPREDPDLDALVESRAAHLTAYQNRRLARRYRALVARVREVEERQFSGGTALTEAVARNYAKLLAYKDEYEVARLYAAPAYRAALAAEFEGDYKLRFHLAPPLLAKRDRRTGELLKREYGPWMMTAFRLLAPLRFLRGSRLDPFGRTEERQAERALIGEYETTVDRLLKSLSATTLPTAVSLARLPERIRGYGHIKDRAMREAAQERTRLLERLDSPRPAAMAAE